MELRKHYKLNNRQKELYTVLVVKVVMRTTGDLPIELEKRVSAIKDFFGPIRTEEIKRASSDFIEDAVVRWIEVIHTEDKVTWPEIEFPK